MNIAATPGIRHEPELSHFITEVSGHDAVLDYRLSGDTMTIVHTGVPGAISGRGVAARLTETALATARANGWKVRPDCAYADAYIKRHPQHQDLLA